MELLEELTYFGHGLPLCKPAPKLAEFGGNAPRPGCPRDGPCLPAVGDCDVRPTAESMGGGERGQVDAAVPTMHRRQPGQAVLKEGDRALRSAEFDPGRRSLNLDIRGCAVASWALVLVLLAALRQLGSGVQRPLAGDLVAGEGVADRQLLQRYRPAAAGQSPPMLQRALGKPDGARRVARGPSLVGLADQHIGHHVWVADLLG